MSYSGHGQFKTYDRLQIPNYSVEKRKSGVGTNYIESWRRRDEGGPSSHTLKYIFDFSQDGRPSRGRLSAAPGIVEVPNIPRRDARTGGAPAGAPGSAAQVQNPRPRQPQSSSQAAARRSGGRPAATGRDQAKGRVSSASGAPGRPASGSATDFQSVAPKSKGIRAPHLKDSMQELGIPNGARPAVQRGPKGSGEAAGAGRPRAGQKGASHAASMAAKHPKPAKGKGAKPPASTVVDVAEESFPPKLSKRENAMRGLDQSERTVVGFDISRTVFAKPPKHAAAVKVDPARAQSRMRSVKATLSIIVAIAVVFVLFVASLSRSAQVSDITRQNAELERSNSTLEDDVSKLRMRIALQDDLNEVKERAADLGLALPDEDQVEYVDMGPQEVAPDDSIVQEEEQLSDTAQAGMSETSGG